MEPALLLAAPERYQTIPPSCRTQVRHTDADHRGPWMLANILARLVSRRADGKRRRAGGQRRSNRARQPSKNDKARFILG